MDDEAAAAGARLADDRSSTGRLAGEQVVWIDGRLVPAVEAVIRADDGAFTSGVGCYTTARIHAGRIRHEAHAVARLVRDAERLGLGVVDADRVADGMRALARVRFGEGEGIVRMQASRDGSGCLRLVGLAREVGAEPATWRAVVSRVVHPGPQGAPGVKLSGRPALARAAAEAREAGADEALLFDARGRVVEGTRSNLVVVGPDGPAIPAPSLGAVAGVALAIVRDEVELAERELGRDALAQASEVVAINAVRGARAVVSIDGAVVGDGGAGPWAVRLGALLDAAA